MSGRRITFVKVSRDFCCVQAKGVVKHQHLRLPALAQAESNTVRTIRIAFLIVTSRNFTTP